jgi:glycosyltransferase involved in cell wall biosynthesis
MCKHIAIIWQRFLPYHWVRIRHASLRLHELGYRLVAIEVASQDASYSFPSNNTKNKIEYVSCFHSQSYHDQKANEVYEAILKTLNNLKPDVVFAPATPFPEGMAAVAYRLHAKKRLVMMDDAWEHTDRRGFLIKRIKRLIHQNIDAAFIPAPSHLSYYSDMGFPEDRILFGVDVVDNEYFSQKAELARQKKVEIMKRYQMPENYFLFVGRFLPRKGIETLIESYRKYLALQEGQKSWDLVLVGDGSYLEKIRRMANDIPKVHFIGSQFGDDLCNYYGLAKVLIVPSEIDPWGLVINEGMASGLPVIVSRGCGAAKTLVHEGENGWIFQPGDIDKLANLLDDISRTENHILRKMGEMSQKIIGDWSLDRFAEGVIQAIRIPRRKPAGVVSNTLAKLWKGRVRIY